MDSALQTYVAESLELLQNMEDALLRLDQEEDKEGKHELHNTIFRAAHTIKGSAGLFGMDDTVAFTHDVENLLDKLRVGALHASNDMIALLLDCGDHIKNLVYQAELGSEIETEALHANGAGLTKRLHAFGADTKIHTIETPVPQTVEAPVEHINGSRASNDNWNISLRFGPDSLRDGMDPLSVLRYLGTIGEIVNIITLEDNIPAGISMDPETCYLGFELSFKSDADKETIESAFDFVRDSSLVRILPPHSLLSECVRYIHALPEEDKRLGDILVSCGSLTQAELDEALRIQDEMQARDVSQLLGDIAVKSGMTSQTVVDAAVEKQAQVRDGKAREAQSIRVDADKLDNLINLIGELVIAGASTSLNVKANGDGTLIESVSTLTSLMEEVRDSALRLRMVQIGATFNRFRRVVHDVSKELGKDIELVISGAETELDKTVVEKIADPLIHLVRNSMDHGIEPAKVRLERGKSSTGIQRLNAYHDSGNVVIEVSDDGDGLNRDKILGKAIENGLVAEGQHLEDQDIYNLIFEPGFSTAEQVSNLSGRGVGMDVVKRNITALRGTVDIESRPREGTTFKIRMPLTLAIINGFLVSVDQATFIVPLDMVLECVERHRVSHSADTNQNYMNLHGEVVPLIDLHEMFALNGQPPQRENVVVVQHAGNKAGLVVNQLMGEFQTVIKPLGKIFSHLRGISGSTILGNGQVALILDVPGLIHQVSSKESHFVTATI